MTMNSSRRAFLKRASALSIAGSAAPFVLDLASIGEAAAATATDYKAIVCVYLSGGNDYANTLVPYDTRQYSAYQAQRPDLSYMKPALDATLLRPATPLPDDAQYALAPNLAKLLPIFAAGKMAVMLNVGSLVHPTSKAQYLSKSVPLPPRLMSHNDQQNFWLSSKPEGAPTGWGGRIGDLFQSGNGTSTLTCINASASTVFLTGNAAVQYTVPPSGPVGLTARQQDMPRKYISALEQLIGSGGSHLLQAEYGAVGKRALDLHGRVSTALANARVTATPFPNSSDNASLGAQLKLVAKLISMASELGAKRQVFFVSIGGFDTHSGLATTHPGLMAALADALRAFYDTTVELGVSDRVTTFTASDFGRSLTANHGGSDHGWGSVQFVLGGAVRGGQYYGINPVLANNGPDDIGQGRLIPTMSVEQYAATMAQWFGVSGSDLVTVLPNIGNYAGSPLGMNLGFV